MGVKVSGLIETDAMLTVVEMETKRRVVKEMIAAGQRIRDTAKKMAPVDVGGLEEAIKMTPDESTPMPMRDQRGRFAKVDVEIYVDMNMPARSRDRNGNVIERPGKTVGDYAYEMHEHLTPMGPLQLGPRSVDKQASQAELVGGGFLERAADEVLDKTDFLAEE